jgi:2-oxoglutarate ferredoxin oxidoreductase subunit delta
MAMDGRSSQLWSGGVFDNHWKSLIRTKTLFGGQIFSMPFNAKVHRDKCKVCEECVEVCTVRVFEMQERKAVPANVRDCFGCQSCVEVCKEKAITVKELEVEMSEIARMLLKDIL